MFREMRRSNQQLKDDEAREILAHGKSGVLAVVGDDGYPYTVPLNYVYADGMIYFHCAKSGHKLDAIRACDKVSFCVVERDTVIPEKYATYYRSAVAFGRARIVDDPSEKMKSLRLLGDKYNPGQDRALDAEVSSGFDRLEMVAITIEHLTGKQAKDLARAARQAAGANVSE